MERVLYNTVLGAKPIQPDGRSFYYSDYNFSASKFFHPDRWPCCSGTLPQISADYRISSYFRDPRGIYVNLYLPSTLTGTYSGATYRLILRTSYPYSDHIRLEMTVSQPATFSVFLRIPAWAQGARIGGAGLSSEGTVDAGRFAEIRQEWRSGDRVELTLPRPLRLEAIDAEHPGVVALLCGPLVLMQLAPGESRFSRPALLSAQQSSSPPYAWTMVSLPRARMISFMDIRDEHYSTYVRV